MWTFDRPDRLRALADRTALMALNLRRELCDAPRGTGERGRFLRRLAVVETRLDRFRLLARVAGHNARQDARRLAVG